MLMLIKKNTVFLPKIEWFMKRCFCLYYYSAFSNEIQ